MSSTDSQSGRPPRRPPPNYFSRREQLRLMLLVGSLGLILVLIVRAADPKTWYWIAPPDSEGGVSADVVEAPSTPTPQRVERKAADGHGSLAGEFRVANEIPRATPYTLGKLADRGAQEAKSLWAEPDALAQVVDNAPFRSDDFEAWAQIFDRLRATSQREFAAQGAESVQFSQLFQQSSVYRGRLVRISGTVRRCVEIAPSKLDARAGGMWQLWLFAGGESSPIVIYCQDLPDEFPRGAQITQQVSLQGVYFKKWVYPAQGGTMTAPLVLAKTIDWQPSGSSPKGPSQRELILSSIVTVVGAIVVIAVIWWNNRNADSQAEKLIRNRNRKEFERHADELDVGVSVRDQLGQLAARMEQPSARSTEEDTRHE